jgi:hypothetical protein
MGEEIHHSYKVFLKMGEVVQQLLMRDEVVQREVVVQLDKMDDVQEALIPSRMVEVLVVVVAVAVVVVVVVVDILKALYINQPTFHLVSKKKICKYDFLQLILIFTTITTRCNRRRGRRGNSTTAMLLRMLRLLELILLLTFPLDLFFILIMLTCWSNC